MDIGIIGAGHIGGVLARRLTALGHQVRIANACGAESLATLAAETGATASTVELGPEDKASQQDRQPGGICKTSRS
jgi:predicted dinucleotide-binding enzyme